MSASKLYRNLKPGEKFVVSREDGIHATVTVSRVQETSKAWFTGRRQWEVCGNYPWWWTIPIRAYSTDKVTLVS